VYVPTDPAERLTKHKFAFVYLARRFSIREPQPQYGGVVWGRGSESFLVMQARPAVSGGMKGSTIGIEVHEAFQGGKNKMRSEETSRRKLYLGYFTV
jgi:hypothetical protein